MSARSDRPSLELDLPGSSALNDAGPAPDGGPAPEVSPLDDDDDFGEIQLGAMPDFAAVPAPQAAPKPTPAAAAGGRNRASHRKPRIHLSRRHAERQPAGGLAMVSAVLLVLLLAAATPFVRPDGIAALESRLGDLSYVPFVAAGVLLLGAWAYTLNKAIVHGSWGLHLGSMGLVGQMICLALASASIISGSSTIMAFRTLLPIASPLASAVVVLGLAAFGLRRAVEELRSDDRRVGLAVVLALLSLAGLGIGVRAARVDLPLPNVLDGGELVLWTSLE